MIATEDYLKLCREYIEISDSSLRGGTDLVISVGPILFAIRSDDPTQGRVVGQTASQAPYEALAVGVGLKFQKGKE